MEKAAQHLLILRNKSMTVWMMTFSKPKEGGEMLRKLRKLFKDESGQDMIEYALLSSLVAIFLITVLLLLGPAIESLFQSVIDAF